MTAALHPEKRAPRLPSPARHRVILPVYIPSSDGYFRDAEVILSSCLESLELTAGDEVSVTVVSNGWTPSCRALLIKLQERGTIEQLVLNGANRGKTDALLAIARASTEELITIADYDVLFRPGWISRTCEVFRQFPATGYVAPFPSPRHEWYHNSATTVGAFARRMITVGSVIDPEVQLQFARTIPHEARYYPEQFEPQLLVAKNGTKACLGAGHFVYTLRREVVDALPRTPTRISLGGERVHVDARIDGAGYWRLATAGEYALHMGNVLQPWVDEELKRIRTAREKPEPGGPLPELELGPVERLPARVRRSLSYRIFRRLASHKAGRPVVARW